MLLLIWSIYVLGTGTYPITDKVGLKGRTARLCGLFNLAVSLGLVGAVIPIPNMMVSVVVQLVLIVGVVLVALAIHGNDFRQADGVPSGPAPPQAVRLEAPPAASENEPAAGGETSRRSRKAIWLAIALLGGTFAVAMAVLVTTLIRPSGRSTGPSLSRTAVGPSDSRGDGLKFSIDKQEWLALPAGTRVQTGSREVTIAKDLAFATVALRVRNPSDTAALLKPPITFVGGDGSTMPLRLAKIDGRTSEGWPDEGLAVPAGKHIMLELKSKGEEYSGFSRAQPLAVRLGHHDIRLVLEALPSWEVLCERRRRIERRTAEAPLEFSIERQKWGAVLAGAKVHTNGREYTLDEDFVSVELTLAVRNRSSSSTSFSPSANLIGSDGSEITIFHVHEAEGGSHETLEDGDIVVPRGERVVLELSSTLEEYRVLSRAEALAIDFPNHVKRLDLQPLPPWKVLYEQYRDRDKQARQRGLELSVGSQQWLALPHGTEVHVEGEKQTVAVNLARVTVLLTVRNPSTSDSAFEGPVVLTGSNAIAIAIFAVSEKGGAASNREPQGRIPVPAGQSVVLKLTSHFVRYSELSTLQPLRIRLSSREEPLVLDPLPRWEVLLEERRKIIESRRRP